MNRQPSRWRERREVEVTGILEHRIAQMSPEERKARLIGLQAKAALIIDGEACREPGFPNAPIDDPPVMLSGKVQRGLEGATGPVRNAAAQPLADLGHADGGPYFPQACRHCADMPPMSWLISVYNTNRRYQ